MVTFIKVIANGLQVQQIFSVQLLSIVLCWILVTLTVCMLFCILFYFCICTICQYISLLIRLCLFNFY